MVLSTKTRGYVVMAGVLAHAYSCRSRGGTNILKIFTELLSSGTNPIRTIIADLIGIYLIGATLRKLRAISRMSYKDWKDLIGGDTPEASPRRHES